MCNIISSHSNVSAVQDKSHWGIKESNVYKNWRYWNTSSIEGKIKMLEMYSSGDYFKLSNINKKTFYEQPPTDFINLFFRLMEKLSKKESSKYWLTKIDPRFYIDRERYETFVRRVSKRYDDPKFISVKREYLKMLKSYVNMQGRNNQRRNSFGVRELAVILSAARYVKHYSEIKLLLSSKSGHAVNFRSIRNNKKRVVKEISNYLDISYSDSMLKDTYPANSSYKKRKKVREVPDTEKWIAKNWIIPLFEKYPYIAYLVLKIRNLMRSDHCPLSWRITKLRYFPNEFKEELKQKRQVGLLEVLFDSSD